MEQNLGEVKPVFGTTSYRCCPSEDRKLLKIYGNMITVFSDLSRDHLSSLP